MKWPRFSILSLILLAAVIALATRVWQLNSELAAIKPELNRLRAEVYRFDSTELGSTEDRKTAFDNETLSDLNVAETASSSGGYKLIQLPTESLYHWRWRVRIPDGKDCTLVCVSGKIPKTGLKTKKWMYSTMNIGSFTQREVVLDLTISKGFNGKYGVTVSYGKRSNVLLEYDDGPPQWLAGRVQYGVDVVGADGPVAFDAEDRVPILRLRSTPAPDETHGDGVLVWLSVGKHDSPRKVEADADAR